MTIAIILVFAFIAAGIYIWQGFKAIEEDAKWY